MLVGKLIEIVAFSSAEALTEMFGDSLVSIGLTSLSVEFSGIAGIVKIDSTLEFQAREVSVIA